MPQDQQILPLRHVQLQARLQSAKATHHLKKLPHEPGSVFKDYRAVAWLDMGFCIVVMFRPLLSVLFQVVCLIGVLYIVVMFY